MIKMLYITSDSMKWENLLEAEEHEKAISKPSRTLTFSGHSDDCKMVMGTSYPEPDEFYNGHVEVIDSTGLGLKVFIEYVNPGVWMIGLSQLDEDAEFPNWSLTWSSNGYSTILKMEVPAGTTVTLRDAPEDNE